MTISAETFTSAHMGKFSYDEMLVDGVAVPRLRVHGTQDVLVVYIPEFGGCFESIHASYLADFCSEQGYHFVTHAWPGAYCEGRIVEGMSIVGSNRQAAAMFTKAADEVGARTKIIVIGASVGTTPTLRIGKDHADIVDHLLLLSPGYNLRKHMIEPCLRKQSYEEWQAQGTPLVHLFAGHNGVKKGLIPQDDLAVASENYEYFKDGQPLTEMSSVTVFYGKNDRQISEACTLRLGDLIKPRDGSAVEMIAIEEAGHLFTRPCDLAMIATKLQQIIGMPTHR